MALNRAIADTRDLSDRHDSIVKPTVYYANHRRAGRTAVVRLMSRYPRRPEETSAQYVARLRLALLDEPPK